jgi:hypothetical protein
MKASSSAVRPLDLLIVFSVIQATYPQIGVTNVFWAAVQGFLAR